MTKLPAPWELPADGRRPDVLGREALTDFSPLTGRTPVVHVPAPGDQLQICAGDTANNDLLMTRIYHDDHATATTDHSRIILTDK